MKRLLMLLTAVTIAVLAVFALSSCGDGHVHSYAIEKAEEGYLASSANCESSAKYYYSCSCGAKGTETFEYGAPLGHTNGSAVVENNKAPDCENAGSYDNVI